jgi:hypothetical protein
LPWRTQPYPVRSEPPVSVSEPKSEPLSISLAIGMDAGEGDASAEPTPAHFLGTACFSGLILNFKNTFPKIPNYCSELRFFILLLKNEIIPLNIYYVYTILSINILKKR